MVTCININHKCMLHEHEHECRTRLFVTKSKPNLSRTLESIPKADPGPSMIKDLLQIPNFEKTIMQIGSQICKKKKRLNLQSYKNT